MKCPVCGSSSVVKFGLKVTNEGFKQRYQCKGCSHVFVRGIVRELPEMAKILINGQKKA